MGISVTNLKVAEAQLEFPWNNSTVHITYDPNEYTPELEAEWEELEAKGWMGSVLSAFVVKMVKKWDVLGDYDLKQGKFKQGQKMYPLEKAKVDKLPMVFLAEILNQITGDNHPKEEKNENSEDG